MNVNVRRWSPPDHSRTLVLQDGRRFLYADATTDTFRRWTARKGEGLGPPNATQPALQGTSPNP